MSESKPDSTLPAKNGRNSLAEVSNKVKIIQDMILDGRTRAQMLVFATEWNVSERTIDSYIQKARDIVREINKLTLEDNLAIISHNLWEHVRDAKIEGNLAETRHGLMALAKIKGLDQHIINHVIKDDRLYQKITDEELNDILDADFDVQDDDEN